MKRLLLIAMLAACAKTEQAPPQPASIPRIDRSADTTAPSGDTTDASREMDLPGAVPARCRDVNNTKKLRLQTVPFDLDQSELTPQAQKVLDQNVACLKASPATNVVVEGHCDERGTTEYNLTLGEQRAGAVVKYLERMGIEHARMHLLSKGKNEPLCTASTDTCWAQNRRVELK